MMSMFWFEVFLKYFVMVLGGQMDKWFWKEFGSYQYMIEYMVVNGVIQGVYRLRGEEV